MQSVLRTSEWSTFCGALLALVVGCSSTPTDDADLSPEQRRDRALNELRQLFAFSEGVGGGAIDDREVVAIDVERISYRTAEGHPAELRWADVSGVGAVENRDLPRRPVTLFVYLGLETPSVSSAADAVAPRLASEVGLARPYVRLSKRPADARARFLRALRTLQELRRFPPAEQPAEPSEEPEPPAAEQPTEQPAQPSEEPEQPAAEQPAAEQPVQPSEEPEPPATEPPAQPSEEPQQADEPPADEAGRAAWIKARLAKLKAWHEEGLLDETEYAAEKRRLLERW